MQMFEMKASSKYLVQNSISPVESGGQSKQEDDDEEDDAPQRPGDDVYLGLQLDGLLLKNGDTSEIGIWYLTELPRIPKRCQITFHHLVLEISTKEVKNLYMRAIYTVEEMCQKIHRFINIFTTRGNAMMICPQ